MNKRHSISVIVPTYNRDASLMECLVSVMAQDFPGQMEIIVVDQGRGHSQDVLGFFEQSRREITRIEQQVPNLPKARNTGVAAARNELVIFVDDDMVLPPGTVARFAGYFPPASRRAVAGLPISDQAPESSYNDYARLYGTRIRNPKAGLIEHAFYIPSPFCIPARLLRALGGYDENLGRLSPPAYGEDDEFWRRAARSGVRLFIDPGLRVVHRDHLAGGCGSRQTDPALALKYHIKSMVYIRLKHHGCLGAGGWLQLARAYLVNREVLRKAPRDVVRNFRTCWTAIQEVKVFMAENETGNPAPGAFPSMADSL
jgi:GT2 family glycosyltransferase